MPDYKGLRTPRVLQPVAVWWPSRTTAGYGSSAGWTPYLPKPCMIRMRLREVFPYSIFPSYTLL